MLKRTHYCGKVESKNLNQEIVLCGWVDRWRKRRVMLVADAVTRAREGIVVTQSQFASTSAKLTEIDPLTGIANRRTFLERLDELSQTTRVFSVLMLDLDNFKHLNDEFGHLHGDAVLERVARVLADSIRDGDRLARYGGEEFVVLLPGAAERESAELAEALRRCVTLDPICGVDVTVSFGVAAWDGRGEFDFSALFERADQALYCAKDAGRNRVMCAGGDAAETLRAA